MRNKTFKPRYWKLNFNVEILVAWHDLIFCLLAVMLKSFIRSTFRYHLAKNWTLRYFFVYLKVLLVNDLSYIDDVSGSVAVNYYPGVFLYQLPLFRMVVNIQCSHAVSTIIVCKVCKVCLIHNCTLYVWYINFKNVYNVLGTTMYSMIVTCI